MRSFSVDPAIRDTTIKRTQVCVCVCVCDITVPLREVVATLASGNGGIIFRTVFRARFYIVMPIWSSGTHYAWKVVEWSITMFQLSINDKFKCRTRLRGFG